MSSSTSTILHLALARFLSVYALLPSARSELQSEMLTKKLIVLTTESESARLSFDDPCNYNTTINSDKNAYCNHQKHRILTWQSP